jgi:hypothetical protein
MPHIVGTSPIAWYGCVIVRPALSVLRALCS